VNEEDANKAIANLNGYQIEHKRLKVSLARPNCEDTKNTNLYIRNLPLTYEEPQLHEMFAPFGEVIQVRILRDQTTASSRRVGFVIMATKQMAQTAIQQLDNTVPNGGTEPIHVKYADEDGKKRHGPAHNNNNNNNNGNRFMQGNGFQQQRNNNFMGQQQQRGNNFMGGGQNFGMNNNNNNNGNSFMFNNNNNGNNQNLINSLANMGKIKNRSNGHQNRFNPISGNAGNGNSPMNLMNMGNGGNSNGQFNNNSNSSNNNLWNMGGGLSQQNFTSFGNAQNASGFDNLISTIGGGGGGGQGFNNGNSYIGGGNLLEMNGGGIGGGQTNTIYVYGIGQQASESDLYSLFSNCGRIARVNVIKNPKTGLCKGFGFVVFDTIEEAGLAVHHMNGFMYNNRPLQVDR
jgi:RNA recognition motif-containing protein